LQLKDGGNVIDDDFFNGSVEFPYQAKNSLLVRSKVKTTAF
jgi:hypothetical protein